MKPAVIIKWHGEDKIVKFCLLIRINYGSRSEWINSSRVYRFRNAFNHKKKISPQFAFNIYCFKEDYIECGAFEFIKYLSQTVLYSDWISKQVECYCESDGRN